MGVVPVARAQSGLVYVGHYHTEDLRIYRVDGDVPVALEPVAMGAVTHDLALDPETCSTAGT